MGNTLIILLSYILNFILIILIISLLLRIEIWKEVNQFFTNRGIQHNGKYA